MKITISKSQWQEMGRKAGWIKEAGNVTWLIDPKTWDVSFEESECGVEDCEGSPYFRCHECGTKFCRNHVRVCDKCNGTFCEKEIKDHYPCYKRQH